MPQYIALLRGINVGGHRVKMDHLKTIFQSLGVTEVSTFIASGNVIFSSDARDAEALKDSIERHLERQLGYEVATFLRSPAQLAEIVSLGTIDLPERDRPDTSHYVIFLNAPPSESLRSRLTELSSDMDDFQFSEAEVHWRIQGKLSESPLFGTGLDQATRGIPTTTRNMTTLRRLIARTDRPEAT